MQPPASRAPRSATRRSSAPSLDRRGEGRPTVALPRSASRRLVDEYVLVGGGLQNALIALAILHRRPNARLLLVEREPRLGGNHTWCFHASDVGAEPPWLGELVVRRWPGYQVRFARCQRTVLGDYCAITSDRLHQVVTARVAACPNARVIRATAESVDGDGVRLTDGSVWRGAQIVDSRGPTRPVAVSGCQKFFGLELTLARGTAPALPMLMDATVEQDDGYRFEYVLPLSASRLLVEDTYYSESSQLDADRCRQRVLDYAAQAGWRVDRVEREERGVLPIPLRLTPPDAGIAPLRAGYAGGLFHPTTGYSLPVAVRVAACISQNPDKQSLAVAWANLVREHRRQARFCCWLNRMMFGAFEPNRRFGALEHFYRLPDDTLQRFYALQTTALDRARILCGRPPRGFSARRLLTRVSQA